MSTATQPEFAKDSWQTTRNARTLRAYMALRNQEIAGRIRELRGRRPQTVVAEAIGVAERTYQNWEAGDAKPNYRSLQRLAEYYGIGEDYILSGRGTAPAADVEAPGGAPDPFPALGVDEQISRMEARLAGLIETQNDLLARQSQILEGIEAAIRRDEEAAQARVAAEDAWVERVVTRAREALAGDPPSRGSSRRKPSRSATPRG